MSIRVSDLLSEIEGLLDDEHKQYWSEHDKRRNINQALRTCYLWVARANEFIFLEKDSIVVATDDVNVTTTFDLPDRTFYVSHWNNKKYFGATKGFDFRPLWTPASGESSYLNVFSEYMIGLPNMIFNTPFTATGTVDVWVKKFPERVKQNNGVIPVSEVLYDFILEMALFYAHRKDEIPEEQNNLVLHRDQCLDILKTQEGFPDQMGFDWDNLYDSGDA